MGGQDRHLCTRKNSCVGRARFGQTVAHDRRRPSRSQHPETVDVDRRPGWQPPAPCRAASVSAVPRSRRTASRARPGQTLVVPSAAGPTHIAVGHRRRHAHRRRCCATRRPRSCAPRASGRPSPRRWPTSKASMRRARRRQSSKARCWPPTVTQGLKTEPATGGLAGAHARRRRAAQRTAHDWASIVASATAAAAVPGPRSGQHAAGAPHGADDGREGGRGRPRQRARRSRCSTRISWPRWAAAACSASTRAAPSRRAWCGSRTRRATRVGHLALVGKGVMYDSGGISLKPSDGMHAMMKMDMSGAAAVLAAMSSAEGAEVQVGGHRLPDVHRQHAVGQRRSSSATC